MSTSSPSCNHGRPEELPCCSLRKISFRLSSNEVRDGILVLLMAMAKHSRSALRSVLRPFTASQHVLRCIKQYIQQHLPGILNPAKLHPLALNLEGFYSSRLSGGGRGTGKNALNHLSQEGLL